MDPQGNYNPNTLIVRGCVYPVVGMTGWDEQQIIVDFFAHQFILSTDLAVLQRGGELRVPAVPECSPDRAN